MPDNTIYLILGNPRRLVHWQATSGLFENQSDANKRCRILHDVDHIRGFVAPVIVFLFDDFIHAERAMKTPVFMRVMEIIELTDAVWLDPEIGKESKRYVDLRKSEMIEDHKHRLREQSQFTITLKDHNNLPHGLSLSPPEGKISGTPLEK